VMYAAGLIAVEAGLLPWSASWVKSAVRYCYDLARNTRDPEAAAVKAGWKAIARATKTKKQFPYHDAAERKTPMLTDDAVGLHLRRNETSCWLLCPERLDRVGIMDPRLRRSVIEKGKELGLIMASNNASPSVQIRVRTSQNEVEKLRFWILYRVRTVGWAAHH